MFDGAAFLDYIAPDSEYSHKAIEELAYMLNDDVDNFYVNQRMCCEFLPYDDIPTVEVHVNVVDFPLKSHDILRNDKVYELVDLYRLEQVVEPVALEKSVLVGN